MLGTHLAMVKFYLFKLTQPTTHNKLLYESALLWRSKAGAFKKETPVKNNKFVASHDILNYEESVQGCWNTWASSKTKSTNWLLINHALPVSARVKRKEVTCCSVCGMGQEDIKHVFNGGVRVGAGWEGVNIDTANQFGIQVPASFAVALNPGLDGSPAG